MKTIILATSVLLGAVSPCGQEPVDPKFQEKIDKAVEKGVEYLSDESIKNGNELILLTLIHAGVKAGEPKLQSLLKKVTSPSYKLEKVYNVVLAAMSLEEYDRVKYQWQIHRCAQYLVDNTSNRGTAWYGEPSRFVDDIKPVPSPVPTQTPSGDEVTSPGQKPKVLRRILVRQRRMTTNQFDHSNMQYAALGFRACFDAGIVFEKKLIFAIRKHWVKMQQPPEARPSKLALDRKNMNEPPPRKKRKKRGGRSGSAREKERDPTVAPRGWKYKRDSNSVRGSMTVGAVGALCIYDYILGLDWRKDPSVLQGLQWINKHFTVTEHPGRPGKYHYYYLYGLERAGLLFGTERIGDNMWYKTGADYLLAKQKDNGSWNDTGETTYSDVVDTCFAILFLRRATRALGEEREKKKEGKSVATGGKR